jgi:hypothetical protein
VQRDRSAEKARQQGTESGDGNESPIIFYKEIAAEFGVAPLHLGSSLSHLKIAFNIVVAQTPSAAIGLGAHFAKGFQYLEQSYVVAAIPLNDGQGIVSDYRVHRKMLGGWGAEEDD